MHKGSGIEGPDDIEEAEYIAAARRTLDHRDYRSDEFYDDREEKRRVI